MKRTLTFTALILTFFFLASYALTAHASENLQLPQFATPTPMPDGRIVYIVQDGDTCIRISLLSGIPVDQLRALNRLDESCALSVGQELLLGIGGPSGATPTAGPAPTPTVGVPTPTALPGEGNVCISLYDDLDGDALKQDTEVLLADGALSVTGTSGQYSQTAVTAAGVDPSCFEKVPEGTYNISVAIPEGYNPTTQLNYTIEIKAGQQIYVDFGAQVAAEAPIENTDETGSGTGNLLGIVGVGLLLAGLGLGIYAWQAYGRKPFYNMNK